MLDLFIHSDMLPSNGSYNFVAIISTQICTLLWIALALKISLEMDASVHNRELSAGFIQMN